jgi:hypothetical protein
MAVLYIELQDISSGKNCAANCREHPSFSVSLTPGFSPVAGQQAKPSRFNGLARGKTVETVLGSRRTGHPAEAGC